MHEFNCFINFATYMYVVQALKDIAKTLGKKDWNFSADPCSGSEYGWITPAGKYSANNVTCGNCTISDATNATSTDQICHVVSMYVSLSLSDGSDISNKQRTYILVLTCLLIPNDLTKYLLKNANINPIWTPENDVCRSLVSNRSNGNYMHAITYTETDLTLYHVNNSIIKSDHYLDI